MASALAAAHAAGIVHRDLKPANVMLGHSGAVKLLDFGLAKLTQPPQSEGSEPTRPPSPATSAGMLLGTPAYMAPEQVEARPVDARTDVFALGVLLYELVSGERPFRAGSDAALMSAILRDEPAPLGKRCRDCPRALAQLIGRCLQKAPANRPRDAGEVLAGLRGIEGDWRQRATISGRLGRPVVWVPVIAVLLVLAVLAGQHLLQQRERSDALAAGLAEIERLAAADMVVEAFGVLREVERRNPDHPDLRRWWDDLTLPGSLVTDPPGARLRLKAYERPDAEWIDLGESNQAEARLAKAHVRWRIEKPGYRTLELASRGDLERVLLTPEGSERMEMMRVPGGSFGYSTLPERPLDDFWLDRAEVSNAEFQRFVDAGGYQDQAWWQEPIVRDGRVLGFEEAMALFRDSTGRPGPAGWELGRFPDGTDQYPVTGVSWYEASAYARFVGKSLPTAHHWMRAAGHDIHSHVLAFANFDGAGPAPVASRNALGTFGTHDLAGNVAEWVANGDASQRLTLGGHWASSPYLYHDLDGADPLLRSVHVGFRCAFFETPPAGDLLALPLRASGQFPEAVSDEVFAAYARLYRHEPSRRQPVLESSEQTQHWRLEVWRLHADYTGESFRLKLYLPSAVDPPYQVVMFAPPSTAFFLDDIRKAGSREFGFLVRAGRAVAFPVFQGTYERQLPADAGAQARLMRRVNWSKDAGQAIDFLQARDDIAGDRIGFYGLSLGANVGISMLAVEPRFRAGVLQATGLFAFRPPPEFDTLNFAPRIRQPVLMVGGRYDFQNPLETSQRPLFERLGSAPDDKAHFLFDGGHVAPRQQEIMGAVLDWFDQHLGPVSKSPAR
jgi:eukaryotic-like serine/threonine-protein kinase